MTHRCEPPRRIQRKRTKGWRPPPNTIYVGRPTLYGNEWAVGEKHPETGKPMTAQDVVDYFRTHFPIGMRIATPRVLGGRNLSCWCHLCHEHADGLPLGVVCAECAPCHADVLLEWANG